MLQVRVLGIEDEGENGPRTSSPVPPETLLRGFRLPLTDSYSLEIPRLPHSLWSSLSVLERKMTSVGDRSRIPTQTLPMSV